MDRKGSFPRKTVRDTVHLDFLRKAMNWVIDSSIFQDLKTHGNTSWAATQLVILAVLWVWSEKLQLTAAFAEAVVWSDRLLGSVAVGKLPSVDQA
jgi:hypothetical protein